MALTPVRCRGTLQIKEVKIVYEIFLIEIVKRPRCEAATRCSRSLPTAAFRSSVPQAKVGHSSLADRTLHVFLTDDVESTGKARRTQ
jgi:hypothetical protein